MVRSFRDVFRRGESASLASGRAGALPTFLIVGAPKAGTTSLHRYLASHPEIGMSERKELWFFTRDDWRERIGWYREQFPAAFAVRGESSPAYGMYPIFGDVPARIHEAIPGARLIYLVRDPIERLVSHFVEMRERDPARPISTVLDDLDSPANRFVMASMYAFQLDRFRAHFPDERVLVVDQADLLDDREATLRSVFGFLDVDAAHRDPSFAETHNERATKLELNRVGGWLHRRGLYQPGAVVAGLVPSLRRRARALVKTEAPSPVLTDAERGRLRDHFAPDVARLREQTGRSFGSWSV